jgi:hypothetical protein
MDDQLDALADKLRALHETADVPLPDEAARTAAVLYVGSEKLRPPPYKLADELGKLIAGKELLFMRAGVIVTIDPMSGECEPMEPHTFVTWVVQRAGIVLMKGRTTDEDTGKIKIVEGDLGVDLARVILASPNFRVRLPVVESINRVRMPVWRDALDERKDERRKGFKKLHLLPEGYDAQTKTFTCLGLHYREDLDPAEAIQWLNKLIRYFQWGDEARSKAVWVQYFITLFCQGLFIGKAPFGLFVSNLPGSGKSKLAQLCIEPVVGPSTSPSGWNVEDKQETRKELDAAAQDFSHYMWFDDVDRIKVRSTDLNRWITSKTWTCRVLGTGRRFHGVLRAMTIMTGNGLTVDDNLDRRTLWVDLFARMKSSDRPIEPDRIELNEAFFENEEMIKMCLAVQWAMVRWWDECWRPTTKQRFIEGFESWSAVVGSIVEACGFSKGLARYEAPDGGDVEGREWKILATALIDEFCIARSANKAEVTMRDVIRVARQNGLFQDVLTSLDQVMRDLEERVALKKFKWRQVMDEDGDGAELGFKERDPTPEECRHQAAEWTDKSMDSTWAKRFRKSAVAGQYFPGRDGRLYEFGDRCASRQSKFVLAVVGA